MISDAVAMHRMSLEKRIAALEAQRDIAVEVLEYVGRDAMHSYGSHAREALAKIKELQK